MQSGMSRRLCDDHTFGCDGIQLQIREAERGGDQHVQISKVQDILRQKILKRPDRQFLIEHHILKDTNVAPSLQVYEQSLKKARLADNLNDKLLKRPGPLELVEHNILETDPVLKEVIKDGLIPYEKTSCTYENVNLPPCPRGFDEPGSLSERAAAPLDCRQKRSPAGSALPLDGRQLACFYSAESNGPQRGSGKQRTAAGPPAIGADHLRDKTREAWTGTPETDNARTNMKKRRNSLNNGGRHAGRLKSSLIFHEYRGPPDMSRPSSTGQEDCDESHCNNSCKRSVMETYKALLNQQQIFLELLHDLQLHESSPVSVANGQQYSGAQTICQDSSVNVFPAGYGFQQCSDRSDLARSLEALSRLRVSDLRDKCRQRGLFVSGTKQDLIKRITRHDALQRNEPLINLKNGTEKPADIDMSEPRAGRTVSQEACNNERGRFPPARGVAEERSRINESGGAGAETYCEATSGLYPGLEYLNRQVKALQDLNFAQLFAAVDAASSAGCWSSGFEGLFSLPQQVNVEPAAGCYCEEHSL